MTLPDQLRLIVDLLLGKKRPDRAPTARERREDAMEARLERKLVRRLGGAIGRVAASGAPNLDPLAVALREMDNMRWDIKVLGSALARQAYETGIMSAPVPDAPAHVPLTSRVCRQADVESPWFRYWAAQIREAPVYHRKVWEDAFVLQALWEADMLRPGRRGLGFAVGAEALPSYFASQGVDVVATDLDAADDRAQAWSLTNQHAASLARLHHPALVDRDVLEARCRHQAVDMNAIPIDLHGGFDFCWSVCALEHLGSIEHGLAFIENAARCLKPGGVAVHTTEFNLDMSGGTIDNWITVLFQRRHMDALAARLAMRGFVLDAIDDDAGLGVLDGFIDLPPFDGRSAMNWPRAPHLRVSVEGFAATSIGLIVRMTGCATK